MTGSMTPVRLTESVAHRVRRGQRTPRTPLPPDLRCSLPFRCHEACGTRFGVVAYMIIRSRCRLSFSLSLSLSLALCHWLTLSLPGISNANVSRRGNARFTHAGWSLPSIHFRSSNFRTTIAGTRLVS